jgi:hypothetical protein
MAYIGRSVDIGMFEKQVLTPNSSTTTFTLTFAVGSANSLLVVYGGVIQEPQVAYSVSGGGQSIVFSEAPVTGTTLYIIYLGKQLTTPRAAGQETSKQTFTGDGTTTLFTLTDPPVVPAGIMVFVDGILQREGSGNNYVSGGSTINFNGAPDNGAEIDVYTLVKEKVSIDTVADGSITRAKLAASHPYWDAAGNVGVGTTSPSYTSANRNVVAINGTTSSILGLMSGGSARGYLYADATDTILWSEGTRNLTVGTASAGPLIFTTNNSERARFDTLGLRINNTAALQSSSEALTVGSNTFSSVAGAFRNTSTSAATLYISNVDSTANTIQPNIYFTDGGGNRGGIGHKITDASAHYYAQGGFTFYTGAAGFANARISIPSNAAGIAFPATQVASSDPNTLDDYEEGTWTVAATNVTVNSGTMAYVGVYTKIGNLVHFTISARNTGGTFTAVADNAYFTLPFSTTTDNNNNIYAGCTVLNVATTTSGGVGQIGPSGNVRMATTFTNVTWLSITGTYRTTT